MEKILILTCWEIVDGPEFTCLIKVDAVKNIFLPPETLDKF